MAKPIYAGSYPSRGRGRGKSVFIVVVLLQLAAIAAYLIFKKDPSDEPVDTPPAPPVSDPFSSTGLEGLSSSLQIASTELLEPVSTMESRAAVSDAQAAIDGGQLLQAKTILDGIVANTPDPDAIKLLGEVNMQLLKSSILMPGKEYYAIQSGDSLSKIATKFNTTVELIKAINNQQSDNIRAGARLLVFNGNFSIRVSKTRNHLDLISNGKLFKRYPVGTGKFGKTPAVVFTIYDKMIEPPWTRPSDNKQIEYGDPENVLGSRWMALRADDHPELTGFGIHGTWEDDSIGKQSSAGCVRMHNSDVEELFDLVPRKTTVIIVD